MQIIASLIYGDSRMLEQAIICSPTNITANSISIATACVTFPRKPASRCKAPSFAAAFGSLQALIQIKLALGIVVLRYYHSRLVKSISSRLYLISEYVYYYIPNCFTQTIRSFLTNHILFHSISNSLTTGYFIPVFNISYRQFKSQIF